MIMYFHPSVFRCVLLRWVRLLGFAIMYGTVILKLYRYMPVTPVTYEISGTLNWFLSVRAESCEVKIETGPSSPPSSSPFFLISFLVSSAFKSRLCRQASFFNDVFSSLCVVCFRIQPRNPPYFILILFCLPWLLWSIWFYCMFWMAIYFPSTVS